MSRLTASIKNGTNNLVVAESFLVDSSQPLTVTIPTADRKNSNLVFRFQPGDVVRPVFSAIAGENSINVDVQLGGRTGSYVATSRAFETIIGGLRYSILFSVTVVVGTTVRAEVAIYEMGRGLLNARS